MSHAWNRKSSQPRERKNLLGRKKTGAQQSIKPACMCIAYESADGEDYSACHCGHAPEEHTSSGCAGEVSTPEGRHG